MVLAVGARFIGQASSSTPQSSATSAACASVERGVAGHGDQTCAQPLERFEQRATSSSVSPEYDSASTHVVGLDHAEIAVHGLGGMQEERGRAGAGERGRDLAADDAGLAHAGDDHPAAARRGAAAPPGRSARRADRRAPRMAAASVSRTCRESSAADGATRDGRSSRPSRRAGRSADARAALRGSQAAGRGAARSAASLFALRRVLVHLQEDAVRRRPRRRARQRLDVLGLAGGARRRPPPGSCSLCVTSKITG